MLEHVKRKQAYTRYLVDIKPPWIRVNPDWQYGVLNNNLDDKKKPSSERFIVYHPKSRTPFTVIHRPPMAEQVTTLIPVLETL